MIVLRQDLFFTYYNYQSVIPGDSKPVDDDLVLWFTKYI